MTVACPNRRCPEHGIPKAVLPGTPDEPIICGACGTVTAPTIEPEADT